MQQLRILVIAADVDDTERFRQALHLLGHSMATIPTCAEALRVRPVEIDAAIVAIDEQEAVEGSAALLGIVQGWPTVVLVPNGQDGIVERVLTVGAGAVLEQPIQASTLRVALATARAHRAIAGAATDTDRDTRHLRWLQDAARAMVQCETVAQVLTLAADHVQYGLGYDRIGIMLVDEQASCAVDWINTDTNGRRYVRQDGVLSLAKQSPAWDLRIVRELVGEGRAYHYSQDAWAERGGEQRSRLDGPVREQLVVSVRLGDRLLGWIAVDNLLSSRHIGPEDAPTLVAFAREAAVAIGKAQAQTAAERRAQELALLMEMSLALSAAHEPRALCGVAVEQLAQRFGYDFVSIYLREGSNLRLQSQYGYTTVLDPLPIDGGGVAARTVRLATSHFLPDVSLDSGFLKTMPGIVSEICVPILLDERPVGIVNVESRVPGLLDRQAQTLLELLARQIAAVLEGASLHAATQRHVRELGWLQRMTRDLGGCATTAEVVHTAAEGIQQGFGIDRVCLSLIDEHRQILQNMLHTDTDGKRTVLDLTPLTLEPDSIAWQYGPLRALLRDSVDYADINHAWEECPEPLRPWLDGRVEQQVLLALRGGREGGVARVFGVIAVDNLLSGRLLDPQALTPLIAFTSQVAMALERTRLSEAERRRAQIAEALQRATAVISSSLEATEIQSQVLGHLHDVVEFDSATLFHIDAGISHRIGSYECASAEFMRKEGSFRVQEDPIFAEWLGTGRTSPELIPDTRLDRRWIQLGSGNTPYIEQIRCYLGAPLLIDGQIVGALCLGNMRAHSLDPMAVAATAEFAERLSRALRNARLYDTERAANARMNSALRLQDEFVATVSHELRTPLTSILGFSENLLTYWAKMDDTRRQASVEKIQRAGSRLDRLVRDLLHISRVEAGALQPTITDQPLAPVIRQAVEDLLITFSGQAVIIDPALEAAIVRADGDRLRQVIGNLLDNAAKYSPEGSPIAIEWRIEDQHGILSIRDRGPGIRPESVPMMFRRFGKLDSIVRAGHVGTGLGLYICKQLVEAMGGRIWYEAGTYPLPQTGANFSIQLPLAG